ncbi:hypothetical protein LZ31DRAFT_263673 [Colletotrichum somersetense]|nr:hypothetical protein LZ31DRAFT_263673 [Colletotrichum somersetense]
MPGSNNSKYPRSKILSFLQVLSSSDLLSLGVGSLESRRLNSFTYICIYIYIYIYVCVCVYWTRIERLLIPIVISFGRHSFPLLPLVSSLNYYNYIPTPLAPPIDMGGFLVL